MDKEYKNLIIESLKTLQCHSDLEKANYLSDKVICDFLTTIGYSDIVDEYIKIKELIKQAQ